MISVKASNLWLKNFATKNHGSLTIILILGEILNDEQSILLICITSISHVRYNIILNWNRQMQQLWVALKTKDKGFFRVVADQTLNAFLFSKLFVTWDLFIPTLFLKPDGMNRNRYICIRNTNRKLLRFYLLRWWDMNGCFLP